MGIQFRLEHTCGGSSARTGTLETAHGPIQTPVFMPVGTTGTVKAVHQKELKTNIRSGLILGNTYHLYLRPGLDVLSKAGGLHRFINWDGALLTDSGGYQVFSLSARRKLTQEGVWFYSHIDGSKHLFTPQSVVDIQRTLGSDIMMALDECPPYPCERKYAMKSMELTHVWLDQGFEHFEKTKPLYGFDQSLIPIAQGSVYDDLREKSLIYIRQFNCPIYAIGGLSVGEPEADLLRLVKLSGMILPVDKARYLMGVGTPKNLLDAIESGIDMFDCVLPTRNARHGILYTTQGIINIRNAKWKEDLSPIDETLGLETSANHSKSYLRHLFYAGEMLAAQLASLQNLRFYTWLMEEARKNIKANTFVKWKSEILQRIDKRL
ncbi:MAG: tRNA guanosine(34) transglycosylase Tgt [Saprospiraceae bacterium]|nr:tRNA guanosine(34) transglycosylase Tgt [Saprospiraceae bacterium]